MIAALFAKWGLSWLFNGLLTAGEVLWQVLKFRVGLPFGILIAAALAAWYWQHTSVVKAVRLKIAEITAKAEIEARDAIIRNNQILLDQKQKEIDEKEQLLEIEREVNKQYEDSVTEANIEREKMEKELEELRKNPPVGDVVAPDSVFNGVRN